MSLDSSSPRLLFFVGDLDYFLSHRFSLAQKAVAEGYNVWVMTPGFASSKILPGPINVFFLEGFHRTSLSFLSLWKERKLILAAFKIVQPDLLHNVAMKPIFLGSRLVNASCGVINDFGGLGYTFTQSSTRLEFKKFILKLIFYFFLPIMIWGKRCVVLCQNFQDFKILKRCVGLKTPVYSIPGSGIDMESFSVLPMPPGPPWKLLFAARLLKEKGLRELVEARKLLPKRGVEIWVCGDIDPKNPSSFTKSQIMEWQEAGLIRWLGFQKDLRSVYAQVHGAVLPSYREGLPRSLLEASAWGRPIITTRVPGCEDVVVDGVTGYLTKPWNSLDLSRTIRMWMEDEKKEEKGRAGHFYVSEYFSKEKIHPQILRLYRTVCS
ncbi:glycosyltransferase family 4 protein [Holospora curviuscula]|uniref:N, N'-diacetylbacillosaminyl-diphospho-undecaprenol alpha-1,3-N-acetylgalactosaminyltransferase n=1 Tax=Holospora curviuscula TaxID=1082868 RepID=A0A2S5RI15_9PROT|nr:glycosyltransferase family 4 protein [Holospora curviuscula]PPE06918.1 N,N'-diacetylbacillosaminyl-diphospho-undecaprenol alpha-1,3-N-acetylgalactosaminyltransferase [Holospora curviuscula]